jgi:hypothetical protein
MITEGEKTVKERGLGRGRFGPGDLDQKRFGPEGGGEEKAKGSGINKMWGRRWSEKIWTRGSNKMKGLGGCGPNLVRIFLEIWTKISPVESRRWGELVRISLSKAHVYSLLWMGKPGPHFVSG